MRTAGTAGRQARRPSSSTRGRRATAMGRSPRPEGAWRVPRRLPLPLPWPGTRPALPDGPTHRRCPPAVARLLPRRTAAALSRSRGAAGLGCAEPAPGAELRAGPAAFSRRPRGRAAERTGLGVWRRLGLSSPSREGKSERDGGADEAPVTLQRQTAPPSCGRPGRRLSPRRPPSRAAVSAAGREFPGEGGTGEWRWTRRCRAVSGL